VLSEVSDCYGLERDFQAARASLKNKLHRQLKIPIRRTLLLGKVAAITGPVESCLDSEHGRR
jgi:hypothetical protein